MPLRVRDTGRLFTAAAAAAIVMAFPGQSVAAENHIQVTREILLESGYGITPNAIIRTPDRGYVIVGWYARNQTWATRVDVNSRVLWRYLGEPVGPEGAHGSNFRGAVLLSDDSVLACGHTTGGPADRPQSVGLLTRLGLHGEVLNRREVQPSLDGTPLNGGGELKACLRTPSGIVAIGETAYWTSTSTPFRKYHGYFWLLGIDPGGQVSSQKLIPQPLRAAGQPMSDIVDALALSNGDVVIQTRSPDLIELNANGAVRTRSSVSLLRNASGEWPRGAENELIVETAADRFQRLAPNSEVGRVPFDSQRAYLLADGSIALFGGEAGCGGTTAAVAWIRSDLRSKESHVFRPTCATAMVEDAIPTGKPGEFATVRLVGPVGHTLSPGEKRLGVVLTFIQFQ